MRVLFDALPAQNVLRPLQRFVAMEPDCLRSLRHTGFERTQ
jgi:hypothetical protein